MKKSIFMAIVAILFTGLLVTPSIAKEKGPSGQAGKSNIGHLYLYEKDANWDIVEGGAWGKMKYNLSGPAFDFEFNGHGLPHGQDFTLIYYIEPSTPTWPSGGTEVVCLGWGTVTGKKCDLEPCEKEGSLRIVGSYETEQLPFADDPNATPENDADKTGAKIWLVPSGDVECIGREDVTLSKIFGWDPSAILFEGELINYEKTE
jgi:hypothetical protein